MDIGELSDRHRVSVVLTGNHLSRHRQSMTVTMTRGSPRKDPLVSSLSHCRNLFRITSSHLLSLNLRELLRDGVRIEAHTQDGLLHHHLLLPHRDVRHRVLDQLPRAPGECPRADDHPSHGLPVSCQHLQQHHQQDSQGRRPNGH